MVEWSDAVILTCFCRVTYALTLEHSFKINVWSLEAELDSPSEHGTLPVSFYRAACEQLTEKLKRNPALTMNHLFQPRSVIQEPRPRYGELQYPT